jgi:hypothetical protein
LIAARTISKGWTFDFFSIKQFFCDIASMNAFRTPSV